MSEEPRRKTARAMDFGKAIRLCRTAQGLTQDDLASRLSIGTSQLSLIECGRRQPSLNALDEISRALHVPHHLLAMLASPVEEMDCIERRREMPEMALAVLRYLLAAGRA